MLCGMDVFHTACIEYEAMLQCFQQVKRKDLTKAADGTICVRVPTSAWRFCMRMCQISSACQPFWPLLCRMPALQLAVQDAALLLMLLRRGDCAGMRPTSCA